MTFLSQRAIYLSIFLVSAALATRAHAQRDLAKVPEPNPVAEREAMRVDPSAEVNLFAADPQIRKPIQSNFDSMGRLWVASSESYPQLAPGEKADDKIIVLEDADGDGVAEKSTVFADGLLIPTGILPDGTDAAYIANATELLYLKDTDGDGKADKKQVVLSGFGTEDTHHLIHTLRWGFDGCLYFNQSIYIHSTVETAYGTRNLDGGGIWRYRPETGELEVFCKGFVNPWGHVFDAYGQSLATDGAYFEGINYVFPDAVFVTSPGAPRWLSGMNPGSPKHCGLTVVSGDHFPQDWQGDLVTNDFRSHRVCRFSLRPEGSSYQSRQQPEVITSSHIAFRPIDAGVGGDGALYISDWYNPIIQHGEVDFRDERRDRSRGRIWRVSFPGRPLLKAPRYANLSVNELVALLRDNALTVRQFARLELKRRDKQQVLAAVDQWVASATSRDEQDLRAMEAMWIDECLNVVNPSRVAQVFAAEDGRIRAAAVRTVGNRRNQIPGSRDMLRRAVADDYPQVRLEAVAALGRGDSAEDCEIALVALDMPVDASLDFSLWNTVRQLAPHWTGELARGTFDDGGKPNRLEFLLSAAGSPEAAEPVVQSVVGKSSLRPLDDVQAGALVVPLAGIVDPGQFGQLVEVSLRGRTWAAEERARLLDGIVAVGVKRGIRPEGLAGSLAGLLQETDNAVLRDALVRAVAAWRVAEAVPALRGLIDRLPKSDGAGTALAVIGALGQIGGEEAIELLKAAAGDTGRAAQQRVGSAVALFAPARPQSLAAMTQLLGEESTRATMIDAMGEVLRREGAAEPVTQLVSTLKLSADDARRLVVVARGASAPEALIEAIRSAGSLSEASWKWSDELRDSILQLAAESGSAERGETIYRRAALQCINCHAIGSGGGLVGPNLVSLGGASTAEYVLRSLIDPNDKLKEGYNTVRVLTVDGRVIQGIPAGGDADTLQLRTAEGLVVSLARGDIEEETNGQSLMPVGLVDSLTREELADLTRFLAALGREPEYTVSTRQIIRAVDTLVWGQEAHVKMNRTSIDAVAVADDPAFQWRPLVSLVSGALPVGEMDQYQPHREVPPASYVRFTVEVGGSGKLSLGMSQIEGVEMWVDGRPTPAEQATALDLQPGKHVIILGLNRREITSGFTVEVL